MPPPLDPDDAAGCLLGLALGDALGAPFEGRSTVAPGEVERLVAGERALRWTDDTHMALTLATALLDQGLTLDPERLGERFAHSYHQEPWRGYGSGPPRVFALAAGGMSYRDAAASLFGGSGSFGNGAAMRVAPAAIAGYPDPSAIAALATVQATVTHSHPEAVDGAVLLAGLVGHALATPADRPLRPSAPALAALPLRSRALQAARARLQGITARGETAATEELLSEAARFGTSVAARSSVPAAVAVALGAGADLPTTIKAAIDLGGDTDTVAAMAGAITGAHLGAAVIPSHLLERLEARDQLTAAALDLATAVAG